MDCRVITILEIITARGGGGGGGGRMCEIRNVYRVPRTTMSKVEEGLKEEAGQWDGDGTCDEMRQ